MADNILKIENLGYDYETEDENGEVIKNVALKDISFEVKKGCFVAIVGSNGSGKSTLAKNLNALFVPSRGRVLVCDMDTKETDPIDIRSKVGMVFQNPDNQLVSSVVEDDVAFGPENLGVDPKEIRERVDEALSKVSMTEHRKKGPHLLSGGQKQRIAIAGVLAMQTECIVFDEPTAMLDPSGRKEIMDIIEELHKEGKTVILITHFMEEAARADEVIVLNKGEILFDGSPKKLFTKDNQELLDKANLKMPMAASLAAELGFKDVVTDEELINAALK